MHSITFAIANVICFDKWYQLYISASLQMNCFMAEHITVQCQFNRIDVCDKVLGVSYDNVKLISSDNKWTFDVGKGFTFHESNRAMFQICL